jgi:hypothetical protein
MAERRVATRDHNKSDDPKKRRINAPKVKSVGADTGQNARAHRAPENLGRPKKESDSDNDSENSLSDTELKEVVEKGGEELKGPRGGTSRWTKLRVEKRQNLPVARPPPGQPEAQPVRVSAYGPPTLESALESAKAWLGDWPYIPNYEKKLLLQDGELPASPCSKKLIMDGRS